MDSATGTVVVSAVTTLGALVAGFLSIRANRKKTEIESTGDITLGMLTAQSERIDEIETGWFVTRKKVRILEIENIDLRHEVSVLELIADRVTVIEEENKFLVDEINNLYDVTLALIEQVVDLGEVPSFTPRPIIRRRDNDKSRSRYKNKE